MFRDRLRVATANAFERVSSPLAILVGVEHLIGHETARNDLVCVRLDESMIEMQVLVQNAVPNQPLAAGLKEAAVAFDEARKREVVQDLSESAARHRFAAIG